MSQLRRPLPAATADDRRVRALASGFESRVPLAEQAAAILSGSPDGRRLADALGVGYVVANPSCTPGLAERLGGTVVVATDDVVVVDVRSPEPS